MSAKNLDVPIDKSNVDFKYFIALALRKELYWKTLKGIFDGVTTDFAKSKELNEILINELETLQSKLLAVLGIEEDSTNISPENLKMAMKDLKMIVKKKNQFSNPKTIIQMIEIQQIQIFFIQ